MKAGGKNMLNLVPSVKTCQYLDGFLKNRTLHYTKGKYDQRIELALEDFVFAEEGAELEICLTGGEKESYSLQIGEDSIKVEAGDEAGVFYAIQTLKQIFTHEQVPCLGISDKPDFAYRGFYHDITRGKIPTVETMKQLIDQMAYYKMNSLQLYVEHVYEFEECRELNETCGFYTKAEMQELDEYCKARFIDFIPSLSTFGHLCELLELDQYKHLRAWENFVPCENRWHERMAHHTLNPLLPESEELVKSLIDQYVPAFSSETFNICCDETFDLTLVKADVDAGKLYVDFSKKIVDYVKSKGKKVMMWGDVLLEYPECIGDMPEDIVFLNWDYEVDTPEEKVKKFSELGRKQIVCPGTGSWSRLCENVAVEEQNITRMADFGHKYGALGILNTNWGDWGNPASLEMAMYGMVLGAAKSWSVGTAVDDDFYRVVNHILYGAEGAVQMLRVVSDAHDQVKWQPFAKDYFEYRYKKEMEPKLRPFLFTEKNVEIVQSAYTDCKKALTEQSWGYEEAREEMLIAMEGICMMAELAAKVKGIPVERMTDTKEWIEKYSKKWEQKNKPCELSRITEMFAYLDTI